MQYLLTEQEYKDLKAEFSDEIQKWVDRANASLKMLQVAKGYPCTQHSYCDSCELEEAKDICFRNRQYGK